MNYSFEIQGTANFFVYRLNEEDVIDQVALNMITNNEIDGLLPIFYSQMDKERTLRFNISSKISLKQFLMYPVKRNVFLKVIETITKTAISMEEYMLEPQYILLDPEHIFVDVSTSNAYLVYLPVSSDKKTIDVKTFLKNLMFDVQYDETDNPDYVIKLINTFNRRGTFTLSDLKLTLNEIASRKPDKEAAKHKQIEIPVPEKPDLQVNNPNKREQASPKSQPVQAIPVMPGSGDKLSGARNKSKENTLSKENGKSVDKSKNAIFRMFNQKEKKDNSPEVRFDIPGVEVPLKLDYPPVFKKTEKEATLPSDSLKQKGKQNSPTENPQTAESNDFFADAINQMPAKNFGSTVILGGSASDSTVFLGIEKARQTQGKAYIIRTNTLERITITANVFRIGKDPGNVDYCIQDNKTISRVHANIVVKEDGFYIIDINSLNHTYVNGKMIPNNQEIRLNDGDRIALSNEVFEFHR